MQCHLFFHLAHPHVLGRLANAKQQVHRNVTHQPQVTTAAAEQHKHSLYDALCADKGYTMMAFAIDTYGAVGKEANKLIEQMSEHSHELTPQQFKRYAYALISVALQCGNAEIA